MGDWFFYLGIAAALATLGVLMFGIGGFGTGRMTAKTQNRMMRYRIIAQAAAVGLLLIAFLVTGGGK
ncbi:MAG: HIG1 domain-containing protein [Paracoccaceae bacterium]|mgnify:CR=1 FL=1